MSEQGTEEWMTERLGKVTASRVVDMIAKTKTGWGASRANYAAQLIAERLTGEQQTSYVNAAMQWGTDHEPDARSAYEFVTDVEVTKVGFVEHPKIKLSGASPDGLVGSDGLVEFKCPNTATHIDTLLGGSVDGKYVTQMMWQMACTKRKWCDWVSFDPRMPESMRLFVVRIKRDDAIVSDLEKQVIVFLAEIDEKVKSLNDKYGRQAAA